MPYSTSDPLVTREVQAIRARVSADPGGPVFPGSYTDHYQRDVALLLRLLDAQTETDLRANPDVVKLQRRLTDVEDENVRLHKAIAEVPDAGEAIKALTQAADLLTEAKANAQTTKEAALRLVGMTEAIKAERDEAVAALHRRDVDYTLWGVASPRDPVGEWTEQFDTREEAEAVLASPAAKGYRLVRLDVTVVDPADEDA